MVAEFVQPHDDDAETSTRTSPGTHEIQIREGHLVDDRGDSYAISRIPGSPQVTIRLTSLQHPFDTITQADPPVARLQRAMPMTSLRHEDRPSSQPSSQYFSRLHEELRLRAAAKRRLREAEGGPTAAEYMDQIIGSEENRERLWQALVDEGLVDNEE